LSGAFAQTQVYALESGYEPLSCSLEFGACHGPTVHLINAVTGHDLLSLEVAPQPQTGRSMRLSSDGGTLFVTSVSRFNGNGAGTLTIVDALARKVLAQVTVGAGAADVAILPDNSRAYVVNTAGNSVSVVDLSSFTVVATLAVQSAPSRIVVSPDGNSLYVTNSGSGTVSKLSAASNSVAAHIAVGTNPRGLDISPDGTRLFVANSGSSSISVIDAGNDSVLRVLTAGSSGLQPQDVSAQSATRFYVTLSGSSSNSALQLLNAADGAIIGSALIGSGAKLAKDPSGTPAYVVDTTASQLKLAAADGSSVTNIAFGFWTAAAVVTDPCAFEASASRTVFGFSGGSATLTIPAAAGCSWTIDPAGFTGLSIAGPLSGTGSATRTFTVPPSSIARLRTLGIGRQTMTLEQTIPRMNVEFSSGGPVRQGPFTITGWAIDEHPFSDDTPLTRSGVDQIHVWAYPAGGAAPLLVGLASYGQRRPDIAALFGTKYQFSGFSIPVGNLPSGSYTLAFFAHSTRSFTFSNVQTVNVTVLQVGAVIAIDSPSAGVVRGPLFLVGGWAVDPGAGTGPGVDVVHVWAYPASGAAPVFLGAATYGGPRPDAAAALGLGTSFRNCGYQRAGSLPPGDYTLVVFARSVATKQFSSQTVRITVQ
jgi:YVTN family beta-propeller protein